MRGVTLLIIIKIRMYMDRTVPYTNMVELFKHRAVPRSQKRWVRNEPHIA